MEPTYIAGKDFDKIDFTANPPIKGEYENCSFTNCNFSDVNLSDFKFIDCVFVACNLSLAKLLRTALRGVNFKDCKMLGLRFDNCNDFGFAVGFDNCTLNLSCFYQRKLRKATFKKSSLHEVDFTECDLTAAIFDNCDLARAAFDRTILEKSDFRTAFNYSFDPGLNKIKGARFSLMGVAGLLDKYDIEIDRHG